jgi:hypothetical protein
VIKTLISYLIASLGREKGRHRIFLANDASKEN